MCIVTKDVVIKDHGKTIRFGYKDNQMNDSLHMVEKFFIEACNKVNSTIIMKKKVVIVELN